MPADKIVFLSKPGRCLLNKVVTILVNPKQLLHCTLMRQQSFSKLSAVITRLRDRRHFSSAVDAFRKLGLSQSLHSLTDLLL